MHLNQGKFRQNGGSGYILKPEFMLKDKDEFNPNELQFLEIHGILPITLKIMVRTFQPAILCIGTYLPCILVFLLGSYYFDFVF